MAKFRDIVDYFRPYWGLSIVTITASSIYEVIDLVIPYAIGQILNVLSGQQLDRLVKEAIAILSETINYPVNRLLSLGVLLGLIFIATVLRAPTEPWLTSWFHWDIALKSRRIQSQKAIVKILTLPLEFFDENNPGRISGRVARGVLNHTWTYPEVAGQMIPKMFRVPVSLGYWYFGLPFDFSFYYFIKLYSIMLLLINPSRLR